MIPSLHCVVRFSDIQIPEKKLRQGIIIMLACMDHYMSKIFIETPEDLFHSDKIGSYPGNGYNGLRTFHIGFQVVEFQVKYYMKYHLSSRTLAKYAVHI